MRKNIFLGIVGVGLIVSCLVMMLSGLMFQRVILDIIKEDVVQFSSLIHDELEDRIQTNGDWGVIAIGDQGIRVSLIDVDGMVRYDSSLPLSQLDNHKDRTEFKQAMDIGYGEATRYSDSKDEMSYYYARRLSNGMVMRVSKSTDNWTVVFLRHLAIASMPFVLILVFAFGVASHISSLITKPLESLALRFHRGNIDVPYKELLPFQSMILKQREQINQQMMELSRERDKLTGMMNHMNEGFLLLDMQRRIISINEAAISLLKARVGSYFYKNVLSLTRNQEFFSALDQVFGGAHQTKIIVVDGKSIRFFMNGIHDEGVMTGVMVFMLDVSEQIRMEKLRREFTSNVSHELKTPLTSIAGFAEMIHSNMIGSLEDAKYFAGKIQQESQRLLGMVNEILRLSKIEESKDKEFSSMKLNEVILTAIDQLQVIAQPKGIDLVFEETEVVMDANPNLMMELMYNLIDNAIRYNVKDGKVMITASVRDQKVLIRVKDTGLGIPKKYQDRIFERFFTVDKSHSKKLGGTGLGLSIVKHIVEYHHGSIAVQSEVGEGAEFLAILPLHQQAASLVAEKED